ncbi:hypothetical protein [Dechloromonas denitrificans]|uniref:hypothetical protein n=1 Tax=Dechloromonas denitrificans TaxID=281362 RepID=UPI001969AC89|nr:hypothetical protein [Dechloromonas denitrificans]
MVLIAASGAAPARGPWRASEDNTRGWQFMTPEERVEHQARIRSFQRLDECEAYQQAHHRLMLERAAGQGRQLSAGGRDICEHLRPAAARP